MNDKDYYKILGIDKNASEEDIKKAFRRLAHQHHPDKAGGNEQKFKEINEAYQILSDKQKRAQYDRFGSAAFGPGGGFPGGGMGGFDFGGFNVNFGNAADFGDLGDIFETFFEGMGGRPRRPVYERGADIEVAQEITLEEAYRGLIKSFTVRTMVPCEACKGAGGDRKAGMKKCDLCNGRGEVREERRTFFGNFAQVKTCRTCAGTGEVPVKTCQTCKGAGRLSGERRVDLEILPGIRDNQIVKVKGMGAIGERNLGTGDLYVKIHVRPHAVFERRDDDLVVKKELKLTALLLGKKIDVPTIDGRTIKVEIPAHFNLKEALRLPGEGMPHLGAYGRGDLLVDFVIKAPKKVDARLAKLLEELE